MDSSTYRWIVYSLPFVKRVGDEETDGTPTADRSVPRGEVRSPKGGPPMGSQVQIDLRHMLAALSASVIASAVVGSVVVYGNIQAISPALDNIDKRLDEYILQTRESEVRQLEMYRDLDGQIRELRRDLYEPRRLSGSSYLMRPPLIPDTEI